VHPDARKVFFTGIGRMISFPAIISTTLSALNHYNGLASSRVPAPAVLEISNLARPGSLFFGSKHRVWELLFPKLFPNFCCHFILTDLSSHIHFEDENYGI
jgi:hypothetical protein